MSVLTSSRTGGPSSATAKFLFPTVFGGELAAQVYRPDAVTQHLDASTISETLLKEAVQKRSEELLRLTLLLERLQHIYRQHKKGRPAVKTPNEFLMPLAREIVQSMAPLPPLEEWQTNNEWPQEAEFLRRMLTIWPVESDGWETQVTVTATVDSALSKPHIVASVQEQLEAAWHQRPMSTVDVPTLAEACTDVLAHWRGDAAQPGLADVWSALLEVFNEANLDPWAIQHHLTNDPVPIPVIVGPRSARFLDRPVRRRMAGCLRAKKPEELPLLKAFLEREVVRATLPLGLAGLGSRAAFVISNAAVLSLSVSNHEAPASPATPFRDLDKANTKNLTLPAAMTASLKRHALLPNARRTPGSRLAHADADKGDHAISPGLDQLAGHVDISSLLADRHHGPHKRLWPRLLSREMRGREIVTVGDAMTVIRSCFSSWCQDIKAGRLRGTPQAPTPPVGHPADPDPLAALHGLPRHELEALVDAVNRADPDTNTAPDDGPIRALWARLMPNTPDADDRQSMTYTWEEVTLLIKRHLRGQS